MRTLNKKDAFLEVDELIFKGIDFPADPFITNYTM